MLPERGLMGVLSELEPKKVFSCFEEITKIPRGSGNMEKISDYIVRFAMERGLFFVKDELKNVIIIKEASDGYENEPALILQGHMDMVAVKEPDCPLDLKTQGLKAAVRGDEIYAEGTSLGGDDGIAVAYCLALLDSDDIKHPRLEVVLTVDEEVGMDGARGIDLSMLTGNRMINLDSEDEGIFLASCAGGARVRCRLPLKASGTRDGVLKLQMGGLAGGHSGGEIHKERGNSNCLMGRVLYEICRVVPVELAGVEGGLADNAIPRETDALIWVREEDRHVLDGLVEKIEKEIRDELSVKDPGFYLKISGQSKGSYPCITAEDTRRAAAFLHALPNGVQAMSADIPDLVETSLNLGVLTMSAQNGPGLEAEFSVRSSVESAKRALISKLFAVTETAGGSCEVSGDYPGWKYRKDSPLREKMTAVYEKMYGKKPKIEAIHAGLECGILGSRIKDLDCVSIGPDMRDIHTTEETLSISSAARVWEYLIRLLEQKDN